MSEVSWGDRLDLFRWAILAALTAGMVCPLIGALLLVRRTSFYGITLPQFATAGVVFGFVAARANVRPAITMTVWVGAMTGALIGASIVETICLPDSCVAIEATAAVVTGVAALIGVGLVAALVTRSFDEYNEHQIAGTEPPGVGCEVPEEE